MTADTLGGVFSYATELIAALQPLGIRTVLATVGRAPSRDQRAALRDLGDDVEVHESTWPLEWMDEPWAGVASTGDWLAEIAERTRPDCIHLNDYCHGARTWPAPTLVVGHSCVLSWWQAVHGEAAPSRYDAYRDAVRRGLLGARHVVAPSRAMLESLTALYGPLRSASVIPNGVDTSRYLPAHKERLVLGAGRVWDEAKNLASLQRVAAELPWPVMLCGDAQAPHGALGADAESPPVRTLGPIARPRLARWLARAAIYALPARYEPFGLSILEAAASGCALVLGELPSLLENWQGAARFVPPGDDDALRAALLELIEDASLRARLAAEAQARASGLGAAPMAARYADLYRALSKARALPSPLEAPACAS
jgi:glycosyltransferase involved in cell wall biosynthesis